MTSMKRLILILIVFILIIVSFFYLRNSQLGSTISRQVTDNGNFGDAAQEMIDTKNPLSIASLRSGKYEGSAIVIEETLAPGSNYDKYIASYQSEGNKIYALLTVPQGEKPASGWPVVIFNHGYIPPTEYRTTERYIAYTDGFSRNGYIVFRSDYRGHGNSEGEAVGGYGSNAYTIDVINAVSSIKRLRDPSLYFSSKQSESRNTGSRQARTIIVDPNRIGMWGHSMGGHITLRNMVVNKDIKAGVIWAGVVASYPDLINNWRRGGATRTPLPSDARRWRQYLVEQFGEPSEQSKFWQSISSNFYLDDISGPLQIHHGTADTSVPVEFSQKLKKQMQEKNKTVEYYEYPGDDHDITANFGIAMERSIAFFDKYVKNG